MKKIKIIHIISEFDIGGVESFLMDFFKKNDNKKIENVVIVHGSSEGSMEKEAKKLGVEFLHLPRVSKNFFVYLYRVYIILKKDFDIVHVHLNHYSFLVLLISILANKKIRICHAHGVIDKISIKTKMMAYLSKILSTERVACSKMAGESIFKSKNTKIIHNSTGLNNFKYDNKVREDLRSYFEIKEKDTVVIQVGRFVESKNHIFSLSLFEEVVKKNKTIKLFLIGEGELETLIKKECLDRKIEKQVFFLKKDSPVSDYLSMADIFIMPSQKEGLGIAALEAQASGINSIISTEVPKEIILNKNVKYINLNNKKEWIKSIELFSEDNHTNREYESINTLTSKYNSKLSENDLMKFYKGIFL